MAEVITCREKNGRGFERHREAVDELKDESHYSTYPSIAFFLYLVNLMENLETMGMCWQQKWWTMVQN